MPQFHYRTFMCRMKYALGYAVMFVGLIAFIMAGCAVDSLRLHLKGAKLGKPGDATVPIAAPVVSP